MAPDAITRLRLLKPHYRAPNQKRSNHKHEFDGWRCPIFTFTGTHVTPEFPVPLERHFSPEIPAQISGVETSTVRRMFRDEPGAPKHNKRRRRSRPQGAPAGRAN